ncbi:MAG: threonine transporter RhtB [Rikenellaceae bacterium]|nr:threonine transporter RhtB [Rikenellaceae bacterium]
MIVDVIKILFGGLCVGLASSVTVGPVAVLCIQRTLSKGHLSGLLSGLGVALADTIMAILAFSVYALLKSYIDEYNTIIQLCGGIFVVIVGVMIFFKNPVPQIRKNRAGESALWQDFVSMFGFTMANFVVVIPYILAFFTMFNIDLAMQAEVSADVAAMSHTISPMLNNVLVLGGFLLGAMLWWLALTSIINLFRKGFRPRHMLTINRIAGVVICALGLITLISVIIG